MKTITATAARRRFGALLNDVQREPVLVYRRNGGNIVIISAEQYKLMTGITSFEAEPFELPRKMTGFSKGR